MTNTYDSFPEQKYIWWRDWNCIIYIAIIIVFSALLLAVHAAFVYLLQSISQAPHVGYWTCYWLTGLLDVVFLALWCAIDLLLDFEFISSQIKHMTARLKDRWGGKNKQNFSP